MNKNMIIVAVAAFIIGAGAGYGGAIALVHPGTISRSNFAAAAGGNAGFMMRGSANGANGLLSGTVASQDAGSITLNTRDGSSHIVLVTPDTTVSKSVNGSTGDITAGANVIVSGTTNSDGSVSASFIQIRPNMGPGSASRTGQ